MLARLPRVFAPLALPLLLAAVPAVSAADTVVPGNQIVQGFQCVGATCVNGEAMSGPTLMSKSTDTPGLRLMQTGGGFTPQTWDVAGNEANFFVRDNTNGSKLPFRIRPGAPTSSIDIGADGDVSTAGVVQQSLTGLVPAGAVDGAAVLSALRGLTISHFSVGDTTRAMPSGAAFFTAFGLGGDGASLAPQDVASVALAAVKALDARVSTLALTPGPKGDAGASGTAGAKGDAGAPGAAAPATDLVSATARIAALERSNKKLAKSLSTLQKQVRKLAASSKAKAHRSATAAAGGAARANGR